MRDTSITYRLKRFSSASDPGFADALALYTRHIPPELRTDTNEIAHWLGAYASMFGDHFMVFGFYANRNLVGYAQLAYFKAECLLVVDYLVIDEKFRKHNIFYEFTEHLRTTIRSQQLTVDYTVAEVAYENHAENLDVNSRLMIRLLRMMGFGLIKAPYMQPRLGHDNYESEMEAALMIFAGDFSRITSLKRETYLRIVHTIYYKHYERWYSIYPKKRIEYRTKLDELYTTINVAVRAAKSISVNGGEGALPRGETPLEIDDKQTFRGAQISVLFVLTVTVLLLGIQQLFSLALASVLVVFLITLIAFLGFLSIRSEPAFKVMERMIQLLPFFTDKDHIARQRPENPKGPDEGIK